MVRFKWVNDMTSSTLKLIWGCGIKNAAGRVKEKRLIRKLFYLTCAKVMAEE